MAIEFSCPYCKALIRVPDNAGGGKGRCPKCATRISVPKKSPKKPVANTQDDDEPFVLPLAEEAIDSQEPSLPQSGPDKTLAAVSGVPTSFDPAGITKPVLGELPVERSGSRTPVAKSLRKKRSKNSWLVAVTIAAALFAGAGYFVWPTLLTERLTGGLIAETATSLDLPAALIDKSRLRLSPDDVSRLLLKLEQNPVPLNSSSMLIQIAGSDKGLKISLAAGTSARFYRVKLKGNEAINKYLARHSAELEETRSRHLDQAVNDFLAEYEKVLSKKSPSDAVTPFRDSLGLTSLVKGLGHELVAEYGRGLYRCAYQDEDDHLYFLLPPDVSEFKIRGYQHPDGTVVVPAELHVKVKGPIAETNATKEEKASTKAPSAKVEDAAEGEMPDEPNSLPK